MFKFCAIIETNHLDFYQHNSSNWTKGLISNSPSIDTPCKEVQPSFVPCCTTAGPPPYSLSLELISHPPHKIQAHIIRSRKKHRSTTFLISSGNVSHFSFSVKFVLGQRRSYVLGTPTWWMERGHTFGQQCLCAHSCEHTQHTVSHTFLNLYPYNQTCIYSTYSHTLPWTHSKSKRGTTPLFDLQRQIMKKSGAFSRRLLMFFCFCFSKNARSFFLFLKSTSEVEFRDGPLAAAICQLVGDAFAITLQFGKVFVKDFTGS